MHRKGIASLLTMDNIFLVVLFIVALAFLVQSYQLSPLAGNLPKIITWIMMALIAFLLFGKARDYAKTTKDAGPAEEAGTSEAATGKAPAHTVPWFVSFVLIGLYPVLLVIIGFPASTFVFLTGLSILLGLKPHHGLFFGILGALALYALFVVAFQVPMPDGIVLETIRGY